MLKALIVGARGLTLTDDERAFLAAHRPCGFILFARNCEAPDQIRTLVRAVRSAVGDATLPVLIDQEGGRVQRLRPPLGRALPPASAYAARYREAPERAVSAARIVARLVAADLRALDIDVNCAPVLDVPVAGSDRIIGDRAYGIAVDDVVQLGGGVAQGYRDGAVLPVMKHIPGHGRATADSHLALPVVDTAHADLSASDFAPFRALAGIPAAMTAHVVFTAVDPERPASVSPTVHAQVLRGEIGFDGLLMSDDISMRALTGTFAERAGAVIRAGSDVVLHCNGDAAEMAAAADVVPFLSGPALARYQRARAVTAATPLPFDRAAAEAALDWVLGADRPAGLA